MLHDPQLPITRRLILQGSKLVTQRLNWRSVWARLAANISSELGASLAPVMQRTCTKTIPANMFAICTKIISLRTRRSEKAQHNTDTIHLQQRRTLLLEPFSSQNTSHGSSWIFNSGNGDNRRQQTPLTSRWVCSDFVLKVWNNSDTSHGLTGKQLLLQISFMYINHFKKIRKKGHVILCKNCAFLLKTPSTFHWVAGDRWCKWQVSKPNHQNSLVLRTQTVRTTSGPLALSALSAINFSLLCGPGLSFLQTSLWRCAIRLVWTVTSVTSYYQKSNSHRFTLGADTLWNSRSMQ